MGDPRNGPARLLVVSYLYPPASSVGAIRWSTMTKYLRRAGHDVTVLASSAFGARDDDAAQGVVRTRDLSGSVGLRSLLRRGPGAASDPDQVQPPPSRALTRVLVPDSYLVSWLPYAVLAARQILRSRPIDCVITTSPPESAHLLALALGRHRPAWIADLRDGWTFEPHREPFPLRAQRALDARAEAKVITGAERVTSVVRPIVRDIEARFEREARHVPNGWDPEVEPRPSIALDPRMVNVVHTGTLVGAGWRRNPTLFFRALEACLQERPDLRGRLRIVVAGVRTAQDDALLSQFELGEVVQHVGRLSREAAVGLQREADVLLLLSSAPEFLSPVPVKLYEYLAASAPVLAVAPPGSESAEMVTETGAGVCVSPYDEAAMIASINAAADNGLRRAERAAPAAAYVYPAPAEAMMEEIAAAVSARARS